MRNNIALSPHFRLYELEDTRAGGVVTVQPVLIERLQRLRDELHQPVLVTSGFRMPETNKAVGGVEHSQHLYGAGADLVAYDTDCVYLALVAAHHFPFVKVYKDHVHVDVRGLY